MQIKRAFSAFKPESSFIIGFANTIMDYLAEGSYQPPLFDQPDCIHPMELFFEDVAALTSTFFPSFLEKTETVFMSQISFLNVI